MWILDLELELGGVETTAYDAARPELMPASSLICRIVSHAELGSKYSFCYLFTLKQTELSNPSNM